MAGIKNWHRWTLEDISLLKAIYENSKAYGEITKQLRTYFPRYSLDSLQTKARKLGMTRLHHQLPALDRLPPLTLSEPEKAWVACAIDGEGLLSLYPRHSERYRHYTPMIKVFNTNREFTEKFKSLTCSPRPIRVVHSEKYNPNCKIRYEVQIGDMPNVYIILLQVFPYLIIKRRQAKLIIRFVEIQDETIRSKTMHFQKKGPTQEQVEIYSEIRNLNKRGVLS